MAEQRATATDKLVGAYKTMLDRIRTTLSHAEADAIPSLEHNLETAKEKATELNELTREEAERIGDYLRRDIEDAAHFLTASGKALRDWARFDMELVEDKFLDAFSGMVDQTRLELDWLERQANRYGTWHSGEVIGIGTLRCQACGEELHFHAPGHIPPCPACHGSVFKRVSTTDEA